MRLGLAIAAVVLVIDQITKYLIIETFRPDGVVTTPFYSDRVISIMPQFNFIMAWNRGISFSLFSAGSDAETWLLIALQSAITIALLWWMRSLKDRLFLIGAALVAGGAIGNIIDRLRFGAVADFIDFYVGDWHFATFNVADSCITIGVCLWLLDAVVRKPHHDATSANG